jgi:exodeoxyribonuclease VII small subunit
MRLLLRATASGAHPPESPLTGHPVAPHIPASNEAITMAKSKKSEAEEPDKPLEEEINRLEKIVAQLESGKVSLEASIDLFIEGKRIGNRALQRLDALDQRIEIIAGQTPDGSLVTESWEDADHEDEDDDQ